MKGEGDSPYMKNESKFPGWPLLIGLQITVALALLHSFVFGGTIFAYTDIGSDTYFNFVPQVMHLALADYGRSAWSFNIGLGNASPLPLDPFTWLGIVAGPDHVPAMRIWVYLSKILVGGIAFYGFVTTISSRREVAVVCGLAYSFCGYVMTDGQWDPLATEFAAYALILWVLCQQAGRQSLWLIPISVAAVAYSGVFLFSLAVFFGFLLIAEVLATLKPMQVGRRWFGSIVPQSALGVALAAPAVVPTIWVLLNSPRITGAQATFSNRLAEIFSINSPDLYWVQLAALFHKNIQGIGNDYSGWMNYLEGPGYFAGVLPLLLLPQLWRGNSTDRRFLVIGLLVLMAFMAFPAVRYLAFGFGLDYFRINNLWITILLLAMFARALTVVLEKGIDRWLLGGAALILVWMLVLIEAKLGSLMYKPHAIKIVILLIVGLVFLGLFSFRAISGRNFAFALIAFVGVEAVWINHPGFFEKREVVTSRMTGYRDQTIPALEFLRKNDQSFYRIEKTYESVSKCDSVAQDYMGVKSYWLQGKSSVAFFSGLELIPQQSRVKNFTNWLPNFGSRFPLYSLVGVKYILSFQPIDWPGFKWIQDISGVRIYENELALPLGVVYDAQVLQDEFKLLPRTAKDLAIINAVIVQTPHDVVPRRFEMAEFRWRDMDWFDRLYVTPALRLRQRGFQIEKFSPDHITGRVDTDTQGILAFSIPYDRGWSVRVDGHEQPTFIANLGMLATEIKKGKHSVELRYTRPGGMLGISIGLVAAVFLCCWMVLQARRLRSNSARDVDSGSA